MINKSLFLTTKHNKNTCNKYKYSYPLKQCHLFVDARREQEHSVYALTIFLLNKNTIFGKDRFLSITSE